MAEMEDRSEELSETKSIKIRQCTKKSLASSKNMEVPSLSASDYKSELRQKNITLDSAESNSLISDILNRGSRTNSHEQSS